MTLGVWNLYSTTWAILLCLCWCRYQYQCRVIADTYINTGLKTPADTDSLFLLILLILNTCSVIVNIADTDTRGIEFCWDRYMSNTGLKTYADPDTKTAWTPIPLLVREEAQEEWYVSYILQSPSSSSSCKKLPTVNKKLIVTPTQNITCKHILAKGLFLRIYYYEKWQWNGLVFVMKAFILLCKDQGLNFLSKHFVD